MRAEKELTLFRLAVCIYPHEGKGEGEREWTAHTKKILTRISIALVNLRTYRPLKHISRPPPPQQLYCSTSRKLELLFTIVHSQGLSIYTSTKLVMILELKIYTCICHQR